MDGDLFGVRSYKTVVDQHLDRTHLMSRKERRDLEQLQRPCLQEEQEGGLGASAFGLIKRKEGREITSRLEHTPLWDLRSQTDPARELEAEDERKRRLS
jgi:hypothetical protein